ncbi:hypothetical protein SLU01_23090 [Sporosarcina luteola]|uniref:Short-chain dehydrogenase n=1 Tax=Sporosarcina luteola TaxID=582850 RepID=A0A511Z961_9BACL|nr:hypothetical protein [Sporosarcina luteola]GEN83997.1 hypothetical protein SLU01_23090 [Sporosarcina luteola]
MWDVWTFPLAIVILVIAFIGWKAIKNWNQMNVALEERDSGVSEVVEDHPFTANPILWVIGVAALFILFVIFFYWASSK